MIHFVVAFLNGYLAVGAIGVLINYIVAYYFFINWYKVTGKKDWSRFTFTNWFCLSVIVAGIVRYKIGIFEVNQSTSFLKGAFISSGAGLIIMSGVATYFFKKGFKRFGTKEWKIFIPTICYLVFTAIIGVILLINK